MLVIITILMENFNQNKFAKLINVILMVNLQISFILIAEVHCFKIFIKVEYINF